MATIGYAHLPVPAGGDSPTVPAGIAELAEALDPHLLQLPADLAARNNELADAPAQTLAIAANGTTWLKTSSVSNTWLTLWEPLSSWRPLTLKTGLEEGDVGLGVRRREGTRVSLKGRVRRSDTTNIIDPYAFNLGAVPADCIPAGLRSYSGTCSLGGATVDACGRIEVIGANTSNAYGVPGDVLWWYQGTDGTPWVDVSGDYWMD
ncbi:hypothetical protein ACIQUY_29195 [Streptomyces sp. NPDC090231]|uniref:hypothetical protein n=1 Tax=unclassified Streptomyces TaxID=2593676 RepID=UPI0037FAFBAB